MIISRTPYRISFFGGGTDYPDWYLKHGGATLATTIDKYCWVSCRHLPPFFEHRIRVAYSKVEIGQKPEDIVHPSVREVLRHLDIQQGVEIHYDGDLPARSGMGSSSAFTVGLLHALYAMKGQMPSKMQLAQEAIHIEQNRMKETVGSQDQVLSAHGGFNHVLFGTNGAITVRPVTVDPVRVRDLNDSLMLFYTGIRRTASDLAKTYVQNIGEKETQLRTLSRLLDEALRVLDGRDSLDRFGELLHEAWMAKRTLSAQVSNKEVEAIYDAARSAGAVGGKLLGAGGGGFMAFFVPPQHRKSVRNRLSQFIHVPFRFESGGSQIIFYEPGNDYRDEELDRENHSPRPFREIGTNPLAPRSKA